MKSRSSTGSYFYDFVALQLKFYWLSYLGEILSLFENSYRFVLFDDYSRFRRYFHVKILNSNHVGKFIFIDRFLLLAPPFHRAFMCERSGKNYDIFLDLHVGLVILTCSILLLRSWREISDKI